MHNAPGDHPGSGGGGSGRTNITPRMQAARERLAAADMNRTVNAAQRSIKENATGATSGGEKGGKLTPEAQAHTASRLAMADAREVLRQDREGARRERLLERRAVQGGRSRGRPEIS